MATKECEKCGEMVGEAKAFCPACGHSFVEEEKRPEASKFESLDNTIQFGQTMYNMMLSDMGLNISKSPNAPNKVEVLEPASATPEKKADVPAPAPSPEAKRIEVVLEPMSVPPAVERHEERSVQPTGNSNVTRYILAGLIVVVVFILMVAILGLCFYWMRFGF